MGGSKGNRAAKGENAHVLAVDDCSIDLRIVERLLARVSVKVTSADSAAKALEILGVDNEEKAASASDPRGFKFNMIITDYCMPEVTGYDLLRKIKEIKWLKEIPVVVMSSENDPGRIERCMEEGAKDFIIKPMQLADVRRLKSHMRLTKPSKPEKTKSSSNVDDGCCTENQVSVG